MNMIQCSCLISRCLNRKDRRWPIQLPRDTKLFPVALLVSVGVFLPVVVYAHTRHGHVLYFLATNEVERYAPFFLPFVSVFPVEWYVCTPERVSKLSTSLFEKVCEPPRNRTSKIPAFCDTTTVSLAHIVPPSFATLLSKLFLSGPTVHRSECASPPPLCSSRRRGVVFGPRFAFETAMLSWLSRPQFHH